MPGKRSLFTRVLFWALAVMVASELGLRLFGYGNYVIYQPDQRLLWVPSPGHNLTIVNHKPITISPDGFRYREKLGPKKAGQVRIFAFGDSSTMGWGVDDDSNYSADLERLLNSRCSNHAFQVVSAGVNAYPNSIVIERTQKVIEDGFQPDLVIVAYSFNTNLEGFADLQGSARQKLLRQVKLKALVRKSAIYDFLIEGVFRELVYYRVRHLLVAGSLDTTNANEVLDLAKFQSRLSDTLQLCQSRNIQMVLLVLASEGQKAELHPFQKAMIEFAQAHKLPVVDMVESWKSKDHASLFMDHAHPSSEGHELIAEQLFSTIRGVDSYCSSSAPQGQGE